MRSLQLRPRLLRHARAGPGGSGGGACVSSKLHARPGPRTKPAPGFVPSAPLVPVAPPRVGGGNTQQQCPVGALRPDTKSVPWARCMPHARMVPSHRDSGRRPRVELPPAPPSTRLELPENDGRGDHFGRIGKAPKGPVQSESARTPAADRMSQHCAALWIKPEAEQQFGSNLRQRQSQGKYAVKPQPALALVSN